MEFPQLLSTAENIVVLSTSSGFFDASYSYPLWREFFSQFTSKNINSKSTLRRK